MSRLLLVLGTPGVGKSTLARILAKKLGLQLVEVGVLVKREKLYQRFDKGTKSYVMDEKRVRRRLQALISDKEAIIATHSVGLTILPRWVTLVMVLRLDPTVLYRRLRAKRWSRQKIWENVESELVDVCLEEAVRLFGRDKVFEINTTSKSPSRVVSEALRIVRGGTRVSRPQVDWLSTHDPVVLGRRFGWKNSTL